MVNFMLQILTKIPLSVWPLFAILLLGGLRAIKTRETPLAQLLLIPSIFFVLSMMSFFEKYATDPLSVLYWILCLAIGVFIGFLHMKDIKLEFDKKKKKIKVPGSWVPLMLSMTIFSSKFLIGIMSSLMPHLKGSILFLGIELFSTIILGIIVGRAVNCLMKYRGSSMAPSV